LSISRAFFVCELSPETYLFVRGFYAATLTPAMLSIQLPPPIDPPAVIRAVDPSDLSQQILARAPLLPPLPLPSPRTIHTADPLKPNLSPTPHARLVNAILLCDTDGDGIIESSSLRPSLPRLEALFLEIPHTSDADRALLSGVQRVANSPIGAIRYWLPDDVLIVSLLTPQTAEQLAFEHRSVPQKLAAQLPPSVQLGTTPGTFYCGRLFLAAQIEATTPGSSVLSTAHDEAAVGFLHISRLPRFEGRWRGQWVPPPPESDALLQGLQAMVAQQLGAAMRGFETELRPQLRPGEPMRFLLTGFGPFQTTTDEIIENPSALFLGNPKLHFLQQTLNVAFGSSGWFAGDLREVTFQPSAPSELGSSSLDIGVCSEGSLPRPLTIRQVVLPTSDVAVLAENRLSIQAEMREFRPHIVIGLGTGGELGYRLGPFGYFLAPNFTCTVEPYASLLTPSTVAGDMTATTCSLRANFALARAIVAGSEALSREKAALQVAVAMTRELK